MTVNIYKVEVSLNGRDSIIEVIDTNYIVKEKQLKLVRNILQDSLSVEYEEDVYVYLHYIEVK